MSKFDHHHFSTDLNSAVPVVIIVVSLLARQPHYRRTVTGLTLIDDFRFVFTYYALWFPGMGVSLGPIMLHAREYKLPTWLF